MKIIEPMMTSALQTAPRRLAAVAAMAVLAFLSALRAAGPDEITFAVPDAGRITLGVFDKSGKLVRTLHRLAPEKDFQVGLNGYTTRWDGRDDTGRRLPAGRYHLRGYLVGNVHVSGEDYHFNEWASDDQAPKLIRILDFAFLENGDVVLLAAGPAANALLARYSPDKGFLWSNDLTAARAEQAAAGPEPSAASSAPALQLAANGTTAIVRSKAGWDFYALEGGVVAPPKSSEGDLPAAVAANPEAIFEATSAGLTSIGLSDWSAQNILIPPPAFVALDADATRLIGASEDGIRLRKLDAPFEKIPLAAAVTSLSLGTEGTFWIVGKEPGSPSRAVAQISQSGEVLRSLRPELDGPQPDLIRASRTSDTFALLESRPGLQRLRVMERSPEGTWVIAWQRTIEDSSRFGFIEDKLAADAGDKPQAGELTVRLEKNELTGRSDLLSLRADFDKTGTRLVSPDGLPLVDISPRADVARVAISRGGKPDQIRFLQGDRSVVEEFSVGGLNHIIPIDAGDVDLP